MNTKALALVKAQSISMPQRRGDGFTLVELLISMSILSLLMILLTTMVDSAHRAWKEGQSRTEAFQSARTCLELMAREITPAVVDTRTQMVVGPGSILEGSGATNIAPNSPMILWMAPLGDDGDLRAVGYYLYRDVERRFFRLKRIFVAPTDSNGKESPYFPKLVNLNDALDPSMRTNPLNASWFTRSWEQETFDEEDPANTKVVVSSAADGVVAFWIQSIDLQGNPIPAVSKDPKHPDSDLHYNSAAYFQVATSSRFADNTTFRYLRETAQSMKGNRVPAAMDITIVTIDTSVLEKGLLPPEQSNVYNDDGTLNVKESLRLYEEELAAQKIKTARSFTTRAKLVNGH